MTLGLSIDDGSEDHVTEAPAAGLRLVGARAGPCLHVLCAEACLDAVQAELQGLSALVYLKGTLCVAAKDALDEGAEEAAHLLRPRALAASEICGEILAQAGELGMLPPRALLHLSERYPEVRHTRDARAQSA